MRGADHGDVRDLRAPTLRDVALRAGVSAQTVSRVVNNQPMVHHETRRAVWAAVGELRYRPNRAARTLATRRSQLIGVVLPHDGRTDHGASLLAIDHAAQQLGYAVVVRHISTTAPALMRGQLTLLVDLGVEGLIIASPAAEFVEAVAALAAPVPVAYLDAGPDTGHSSDSWQEQAARTAVDQLVALGHERTRKA